MKKLKLMTALLLLFVGGNVMAQELEIPEDIKLETAADYEVTEALVLESIAWLQDNPVASNPTKRKELNRFLIKWISGSPSVTIELLSGLAPIDCPECLISFMGGWTKYSLENDYSKNKIEGALAGAESSIAFYEKNKAELGKNSDIEKMIKQQKKGKLRKYVEGKF